MPSPKKLTKEQALSRLSDWEERHSRIVIERNDLICQAWEAGVQVSIIAAFVGLSAPRIYQIKDGR